MNYVCEVLLKALSAVNASRPGQLWYGHGRHYQSRAGWLWSELFAYIWMIVCHHLAWTWSSEMVSSSWKNGTTCTLFQIHGCCKIPLSFLLSFGLQSLTDTGTKWNVSYWLAEKWSDHCLMACSHASLCSRFFHLFQAKQGHRETVLRQQNATSTNAEVLQGMVLVLQSWAPAPRQQGLQSCLIYFYFYFFKLGSWSHSIGIYLLICKSGSLGKWGYKVSL